MEGLFLSFSLTGRNNSCNFCCLQPKSDAVIVESTEIAPCRHQIMITAKNATDRNSLKLSSGKIRKRKRGNIDSFEPWIAC